MKTPGRVHIENRISGIWQTNSIVNEDLAYLDELADFAARNDAPGALSMSLPRAGTVPDMADRHRENCQATGLVFPD